MILVGAASAFHDELAIRGIDHGNRGKDIFGVFDGAIEDVLTSDNIREVFAVEAEIRHHPGLDKKLVDIICTRDPLSQNGQDDNDSHDDKE